MPILASLSPELCAQPFLMLDSTGEPMTMINLRRSGDPELLRHLVGEWDKPSPAVVYDHRMMT